MVSWQYNGMLIEGHKDCPSEAVGFIYRILYSDGKMYIGKKLIRAIRRVKPTKAMLAVRKNAVRKEWKNLPFVKYEGSSDFTKDKTIVRKEILMFCNTKKQTTYYETKELFLRDCIIDDMYMNHTIQNRFFRRDFKE